jgi:ribonuclease T
VTDINIEELIVKMPEIRAYISVDIETTGPNPSEHSMLSVGACTFFRPRNTFHIEIKPLNRNFTHEAMLIHNLDLDILAETGIEAALAMEKFEQWLSTAVPEGICPIFIGFNAAFDWMFVNDYFHRFLGHNPFGHNALDIKAYYMGLMRVSWVQSSMREVNQHYLDNNRQGLSHQALQDAIDQAAMFEKMLAEAAEKNFA